MQHSTSQSNPGRSAPTRPERISEELRQRVAEWLAFEGSSAEKSERRNWALGAVLFAHGSELISNEEAANLYADIDAAF